ncbi:MAG: hypothetical protein QM722_08750 [Piscinibacter sp.]
MTITVKTTAVDTTSPVEVEMTDASGAHVELVLLVGNQMPIRHAFDFTEGSIRVPLPRMKKGDHKCTLIVLALTHKDNLNGMYDVSLSMNGVAAAEAKGKIPQGRGNDFGRGDFVLTVS